MTTFATIAERTGADRDPGLTTTYSGACPVCGGRRMLLLMPHANGTADVYCITGRCKRDDVVAGLRLRADEVSSGSVPYMFSVRHDLVVDDGAASAATSWAPQDVLSALSGDYSPEETSILRRSDGIALFYAGRIHWLMGESESGKSWLALLAAAEVLNAGERALFVDFESDLQTVGRRLLALGVPLGVLADGLTYVRPTERPEPGSDAERALHDVLTERYAFAVVDGITDALMVYGLDGNAGADVAEFIRAVPRRIAEETGAAVACVDHVVKNAESRGRFAIGSQHKVAGLDGLALIVEPKEPIAPGARGVLSLRVSKDRPGWVRSHAGEWRAKDRTQEAARVVLDSTTAGRTTFEILTPETIDSETGERRDWRPTATMQAVVDFLAGYGEASQTRVEQSVKGRAVTVREAIGFLVSDGIVSASDGPRGSKILALAKPDGPLVMTPSPVPTPSHSVRDEVETVPTTSRVPVSIDGTTDGVADADTDASSALIDQKAEPADRRPLSAPSLDALELPPVKPEHLARARRDDAADA